MNSNLDTGEVRITSPDQLHEYISVAAPGAWFVLLAALAFFAGLFLWLFMGELEVTLPALAYKEGSRAVAFLNADDSSRIRPGMAVRIHDESDKGAGTVLSVSKKRADYKDILAQVGEANAIIMKVAGNNRLFQVTMDVPDGPQDIVQTTFILENVHPAAFLLGGK